MDRVNFDALKLYNNYINDTDVDSEVLWLEDVFSKMADGSDIEVRCKAAEEIYVSLLKELGERMDELGGVRGNTKPEYKVGQVIHTEWEMKITEIFPTQSLPYLVRVTSLGEDGSHFSALVDEHDIQNPPAAFLAAQVARVKFHDK